MTPYRVRVGPEDTVAMRMVRSSTSARLLANMLTGLLVVIALVLGLTPWMQTAVGSGRVVAYAPLDRQQTIEAPIEGRILAWHVREGSRVKAGEPIADIRDNDPLLVDRLREERDAVAARAEAVKARIASIEQRAQALDASRASGIAAAGSRVKMAIERVRAAEQAVEAAAVAERTTTANIERQRALEAKGLASRRAVELAELDHARAATDLDRARAALRAAESEELAIRSDLLKVGNDGSAVADDARATLAAAGAELASINAELARMEVRLARQAAQKVTSPRDGVILRLVANQGTEQVKAGDALAVLVPDTEERGVELWIDGNDVPLVSEGRTVRLQFEGWPAVQFSGWPSIAIGTFEGRVALVDATDDGRGKFRVLVVPAGGAPWPSGGYLRQGVRANGWILLNEVRLGWELWRQFNGFPPSVSPGEAGAPKVGKEGAK